MTAPATSVLTIGHSAHSWERFLALLGSAGVTAIADVRTAPYSRRFPHFNRDRLRDALPLRGIAYVFLGKELGGRPRERGLYCEGVADYEQMAQTEGFKAGVERVILGAGKFRIALMCSEQDPLECHRCLLVGRALAERGVAVGHILGNGEIVPHAGIEAKLLELCGRRVDDLFAAPAQLLAMAYRDRARKVAFAEGEMAARGSQPVRRISEA
jgi:uncharacterized protein (DUF488 family)